MNNNILLSSAFIRNNISYFFTIDLFEKGKNIYYNICIHYICHKVHGVNIKINFELPTTISMTSTIYYCFYYYLLVLKNN